MNRNQFIITQERQPKRCEICHQEDCFDAGNGQCARCQVVMVTMAANYSLYHEPKLKPLLIEMTEQMTPIQTCLILVLSGMFTGMAIDITHFKVELSSSIAIFISALASLPLVLKRSRQFHPIVIGLLFTLTIAPLGWLLLATLNWLVQRLSW